MGGGVMPRVARSRTTLSSCVRAVAPRPRSLRWVGSKNDTPLVCACSGAAPALAPMVRNGSARPRPRDRPTDRPTSTSADRPARAPTDLGTSAWTARMVRIGSATARATDRPTSADRPTRTDRPALDRPRRGPRRARARLPRGTRSCLAMTCRIKKPSTSNENVTVILLFVGSLEVYLATTCRLRVPSLNNSKVTVVITFASSSATARCFAPRSAARARRGPLRRRARTRRRR